MSKKPRKVEEPQASYAAKKPAKAPAPATASGVRYASAKQTHKAAEKVFKVHHELFRKLAQ